jgi:hypothetical protein
MTFQQKLEQVRANFIDQRILISGGDKGEVIPACKPAVGICKDVVKWKDANHVDFILKNNHRYGVGLDEVSETRVSGKTITLAPFVRTVEIIK